MRTPLTIPFFQPIQAFEHPTYKKMIEIAGAATTKILIPNRDQTRDLIVAKFKEQMQALRDRFNVRSHIDIHSTFFVSTDLESRANYARAKLALHVMPGSLAALTDTSHLPVIGLKKRYQGNGF